MIPHKELLPLLKEEDEDDSIPKILVMDGRTGRMSEDNNRNEGLHKGAAAVISKWPEYATSCIWIGVLIALGLFLLAATGVIIAYEGAHMPSCLAELRDRGEAPIHTCVMGDIPNAQINLLAQRYPNKTIHVIVLNKINKNDPPHVANITNNATSAHTNSSIHHNGTAANQTNIKFFRTQPNAYFHKSILHTTWRKLDTSALLLACRALAIWNYGGIALDVKYYLEETMPDCKPSLTAGPQVCNTSQINLPEPADDGFVTGRDGMLLSTAAPCHAFAWDLLFAARVGARNAEDITVDAVETFCRGKQIENCNGIDLI